MHVALGLTCSTEHAHVERGGQVHERVSRPHAGWDPVERMTVQGSGAIVGGRAWDGRRLEVLGTAWAGGP